METFGDPAKTGASLPGDPFDELLELENDFYKEGFGAGVTDSEYAGMIEGKLFGIEKGYEKALELGRLHGRALVWQQRLGEQEDVASPLLGAGSSEAAQDQKPVRSLEELPKKLGRLPDTARLRRHVESILTLTDPSMVTKDNSDSAVSDFDDRISKAQAKAKIVTNRAGEELNPTSTNNNKGIEDATGLSARH